MLSEYNAVQDALSNFSFNIQQIKTNNDQWYKKD